MILLSMPIIVNTASKILFISYTLFTIFSSILDEKICPFVIFVQIKQSDSIFVGCVDEGRAEGRRGRDLREEQAPPLPWGNEFCARTEIPTHKADSRGRLSLQKKKMRAGRRARDGDRVLPTAVGGTKSPSGGAEIPLWHPFCTENPCVR